MMQGGSKLPKGYYECEYIESRGEYFIDTGFVINKGENWEVELDGQFDEPYTFAGANAYLQYQITTNTRSIFKVTYSNYTTTYYVNGTAQSTNNWGSSSTYSNVKLGIFRIGDSGNVWYDTYKPQNGKIYSHKVWKDGNKVFDGIPCVNPEGYFGLYDTVGRQFYRMKEQVEVETTTTVAGATINLGDWTKSTSVANPDSSAYDGVYESNTISHGGLATCTLTNIKCSTIYIRSYGESCCDYAYVVDSNGTKTLGTTQGTSVSGNLISDYTAVNVSGQSAVQVYYTKDSSVTDGTDKGYLLIPKVTGTTTTTQTVDSIGAGKVIIPEDYTWVNGIYGSNGAYINTGYNPNSDTKVIMQAKLYNFSNTAYPFGAISGVGYMFRLLSNNDNFTGAFVQGTTCSVTNLYGDILNIEAGLAALKINGVSSSYSNPSYSCVVPLYLYTSNDNSTANSNYTSMNLYHCAIKDAKTGHLVRLFVPCKNSSNIYGLYDVVNKVWYSSSSSTAFTNELTIINYDFPYTGAVQSVTLGKGTYKLEVWGAQGGCYSSSAINKGGYSTGQLTLSASTKVYIYVGGQPASVTSGSQGAVNPGGFNGGGSAKTVYYSGIYTYGQGGGGGTDIRLVSDTLYNRVIVAGGGAGASDISESYRVHGGGATGGNGNGYFGGTQTTGGSSDTPGTFGKGADAVPGATNYKHAASGGGGGWYGGGASTSYTDSYANYRYGCGGGSGFVWVSGASVPSNYDLSSSYYLTNASTTSGDTAFTSPTGTSETGHAGSGYARITQLS